MNQPPPRFWHAHSQHNHIIIETYCLLCFKFVGASKMAFNLSLVELAHRILCKPDGSDDSLPDSPSGSLPGSLPED